MYNYKSCVDIIPDISTKRQITTAASIVAAYSNSGITNSIGSSSSSSNSINVCAMTPDSFALFGASSCGIQNYDPITGLAGQYNTYTSTSCNLFPNNSCELASSTDIDIAANSLNHGNDLILANLRNAIAQLKNDIAILQTNIGIISTTLQNSTQQYITQSNICATYVDQIKNYRNQIPSVAAQADINCKQIVTVTCQINNCLPLGNAWADLCNSINYIVCYNQSFNSYIDPNYPKQYIGGITNSIENVNAIQIPYGIEARLYEDLDYFGYSWIIQSANLDFTNNVLGVDIPNLADASYQHTTRLYNQTNQVETDILYPNTWLKNVNSARVERYQNLKFDFYPAEKVAGIEYSGWSFNM